MIVVIRDGGGQLHSLEFEGEHVRGVGFRLIKDDDGFMGPSAGYVAFIEHPMTGSHPWIGYAKLDPATSEPNFDHINYVELQKSRIHQVIR